MVQLPAALGARSYSPGGDARPLGSCDIQSWPRPLLWGHMCVHTHMQPSTGVHTHVCTFTHQHTRVYPCTPAHVHSAQLTCLCSHTHIVTPIHTCAQSQAGVHTLTHAHAYTVHNRTGVLHTHAVTHMRTLTHSHACTHSHVHAHPHTCVRVHTNRRTCSSFRALEEGSFWESLSVHAHVCAERGAREESTVLSHIPVDTHASDSPWWVHVAPDVQAWVPGRPCSQLLGGGARTHGHSLIGDLLEDEVIQQGELLRDLQGRVVFKGLCLDAFRLRGTSPESGPPASPRPLWCDLSLVLGGGGKGTAGACAGPCSVSQHSCHKEATLSRMGLRPQRRPEDCDWPTSVGRTRAAWAWSPAVNSGSP